MALYSVFWWFGAKVHVLTSNWRHDVISCLLTSIESSKWKNVVKVFWILWKSLLGEISIKRVNLQSFVWGPYGLIQWTVQSICSVDSGASGPGFNSALWQGLYVCLFLFYCCVVVVCLFVLKSLLTYFLQFLFAMSKLLSHSKECQYRIITTFILPYLPFQRFICKHWSKIRITHKRAPLFWLEQGARRRKFRLPVLTE